MPRDSRTTKKVAVFLFIAAKLNNSEIKGDYKTALEYVHQSKHPIKIFWRDSPSSVAESYQAFQSFATETHYLAYPANDTSFVIEDDCVEFLRDKYVRFENPVYFKCTFFISRFVFIFLETYDGFHR